MTVRRPIASNILSFPVIRAHGRRFAAFVGVGMVNTIFGYGVYLLLLWARLAPLAALGAATVAGAIFNYFSTGSLVFMRRRLGRLPQFILAYCIIYFFNALLLEGLGTLGIGPQLAQATALPIVVVINYFLLNYWVFRTTGRNDARI
jgi:putative flippase GtrA